MRSLTLKTEKKLEHYFDVGRLLVWCALKVQPEKTIGRFKSL